MKLQDLTKKGLNYHLSINMVSPEMVEKLVDGEVIEIRLHKTVVSLMVYDPNKAADNGDPIIVCKVQAVGSGSTQRASERDGIKECLTRIL